MQQIQVMSKYSVVHNANFMNESTKVRNPRHMCGLASDGITTYFTLRGRLKGTASAVFAIQHGF